MDNKETNKETNNIFDMDDNKNQKETENIFDMDDDKKQNDTDNIFDTNDKKGKNEAENIFDMPKKPVFTQPKTTVAKSNNNVNSNKNTKMKNKSGKDLFNFEADEEEDIFSKKDGVSSIFDTDDNDKDRKDNPASSIFD